MRLLQKQGIALVILRLFRKHGVVQHRHTHTPAMVVVVVIIVIIIVIIVISIIYMKLWKRQNKPYHYYSTNDLSTQVRVWPTCDAL